MQSTTFFLVAQYWNRADVRDLRQTTQHPQHPSNILPTSHVQGQMKCLLSASSPRLLQTRFSSPSPEHRNVLNDHNVLHRSSTSRL
jgi:hypothetical protein